MKDVPASTLDVFQLYLGDAAHAFRLCVAVKLSGRIDVEKLRRAADRVATELPILTCRYVGDLHAGRFVNGPVPDPVPVPITADHPDCVMTTLSPCSGPLFGITVCRGATDTLVFSAAHLLTDARGLLGVAVRVAELVRAPDAKQFPETDRTLAPAFRRFSPEVLSELFSREESRFSGALTDTTYFATVPDPDVGLTFVRERFSAEVLGRMKRFAALHDATIHDLLTAAYGTALRDWLRTKGVLLDVVPLCSTVDLRRYFPEGERGFPMNYTVAYWSPVCCGQDFAGTVAGAAVISRERKRTAAGIGAAGPFAGSALLEKDIGRFAGVPFLTNPGRIPSDIMDFGGGLCVEEMEFQGIAPGGSPFTIGAWTYRDVLHLTICTGADLPVSRDILSRVAEILRGL